METNLEHYKDEIVKSMDVNIACAVVYILGKSCKGFGCFKCNRETLEWLNKPYQPPKPKLTLEEKVILSVLPKAYEWIVRDERIGNLLLYKDKPYKSEKGWASSSMKNWNYFDLFNHLFQFIKAEDEEPTHIPTLLANCEVIENE